MVSEEDQAKYRQRSFRRREQVRKKYRGSYEPMD
jgi:hypothetical protein